MPSYPTRSDAQHVLAGRVIAREGPDVIVVAHGSARTIVQGAVSELESGDLVRLALRSDPGRDTELVSILEQHRTIRAPLVARSETASLLAEGRLARLELRAQIRSAIRTAFDTRGYLEVETPCLATCPGLDLHLRAFSVPQGNDPDAYLITSPEYHMKRLVVGGVARCYQFARCFRDGERGRRHEPEFTMLEWYHAWADRSTMLDETVDVLRVAARAAGRDASVRIGEHDVRLDDGYEQLTVREAFGRWASELGDPIELAARDDAAYFQAVVERIEPNLGFQRPTFLTRFPAAHASLSRLAADDPSVCERFEMFVGGVELSNGFVELTDPREQRARFERDQRDRADARLDAYPVDEAFLSALEEGMPPTVGNALGFDRLCALVAGRDSIADVMAFPVARR